MIKYIRNNNYSSYIEVDQKRFLLHRVSINILKESSFQLNDWNLFLKHIRSKRKTLLDAAEEIFGKERDTELEKITWILLEMAAEAHPLIVRRYLMHHAHLCFSKHWIHRYTYFEYHGFTMNKGKGNYLRNKFDKGATGVSPKMQKQISDIMVFGKSDGSLPVRIAPLSKYHAHINIDGSGWIGITVDAHSLHVQASVKKTQELILKTGEQLNRKGPLSAVADQFNISTSIVMMYAFAFHRDLMKLSVKKTLREQMLNNRHISLSGALQKHISQDSNFLVKLKSNAPETYRMLVRLAVKYQNLQISNRNIYNRRLDAMKLRKYHLGYITNKKWKSFQVDLGSISKDTVSRDIRRYALYRASNNKGFASSLIDFFSSVKDRRKRFNIDAGDITEEDLVNWLTKMERRIGLRSAKNPITSFYRYLTDIKTVNREKNAEKIKSIYKTVSSDITAKDQEADNPTVPMPEDVYLQIRARIDELDTEIKNAFLIQCATGCRPSELAAIREDSLKFDQRTDCHILTIYASKQEAAYGKKGKLPVRKVPIYEQDVIRAFREQAEISRAVRRESGNDSIFVRRYRRRHVVKYHIPSSKELIRDVNILIDKYNIKAELDSDTWHYTPYQMRAMIATTMVEKGHAPEEIKAFFGWLTNHTSEKAYAFVRKKKMAELNTELFKKHFRVSFDKKLLGSYSREEREHIFVKLYIHKRQMEYGDCVRHPVVGECGKLQGPESCASCARLNTDSPYLGNWVKIRDSQKAIYDDLVRTLESEGIPRSEYETWHEYLVEKQRLDSFQSLVDRLSPKKDH